MWWIPLPDGGEASVSMDRGSHQLGDEIYTGEEWKEVRGWKVGQIKLMILIMEREDFKSQMWNIVINLYPLIILSTFLSIQVQCTI
jgi:hypothetical protein